MVDIILQYGSWFILALRIVIVCGLFLFIREYLTHKARSEEIRSVHHIVTSFVVALGVMLTQSIIFRFQRVTPLQFNEVEVFLISLTNTLITFTLMVYTYREYKHLLDRVNKK